MGTNLGDLLAAAGLEASDGGDGQGDDESSGRSDGAEPAAPAYADKVVVRRTRKGRGGRTVTLVQGVTAGHEALSQTLKKQLGAGARVEGDEVVVQGDQVERLARWLESQGIRKVVRS